MRYLGGKFHLSRVIAPLVNTAIQEKMRQGYSGEYYEPFVGSAYVMERIHAPYKYGSDINADIIAMWHALQRGWIPPAYVSHAQYVWCRKNKEHIPAHYRAFVGIGCSFGGKLWNGYAQGINKKDETHSAYTSVMRKIQMCQDVVFASHSYTKLEPRNAVVYCDPPYAGTTGYKDTGDAFNHIDLWNTMRVWAADYNNTVYVSEYTAPEWVPCIQEFQRSRRIHPQRATTIERLYCLTKDTI